VRASDLRLLAARLTAEMERLPPGGERDALAVAVRAALREADALDGLQLGTNLGTVGEVDPDRTRAGAISAAMTRNPARLQQIAHERGVGVPELWAAIPRPRPSLNTLKAWVKPAGSAGARRIPQRWAAKLAQVFDEPSLLDPDSWPSGIR
jgi:hypothetical protein